MTAAGGSVDVSCLSKDEVRQILGVLERDERLKETDKQRISQLEHTRRDLRWLRGVTGQWFEEIKKAKYKNESNVNNLLQQSLRVKDRKKLRAELKVGKTRAVGDCSDDMTAGAVLNGSPYRNRLASFFTLRKRHSTYQDAVRKRLGEEAEPDRADTGASHDEQDKQAAEGDSPHQTSRPDRQLEKEVFTVLGDLDSRLTEPDQEILGNPGPNWAELEQKEELKQEEAAGLALQDRDESTAWLLQEEQSQQLTKETGHPRLTVTAQHGTAKGPRGTAVTDTEGKDRVTQGPAADLQTPVAEERQADSAGSSEQWPVIDLSALRRCQSLTSLSSQRQENENFDSMSGFIPLTCPISSVMASDTMRLLAGDVTRQKRDFADSYKLECRVGAMERDAFKWNRAVSVDCAAPLTRRHAISQPLFTLKRQTKTERDVFCETNNRQGRNLSPHSPVLVVSTGSRHREGACWLVGSDPLSSKTVESPVFDSFSTVRKMGCFRNAGDSKVSSPQGKHQSERPTQDTLSHGGFSQTSLCKAHRPVYQGQQVTGPGFPLRRYNSGLLRRTSSVPFDPSEHSLHSPPCTTPFTSTPKNSPGEQGRATQDSYKALTLSADGKPPPSPLRYSRAGLGEDYGENVGCRRQFSRAESLLCLSGAGLSPPPLGRASADSGAQWGPAHHAQDDVGSQGLARQPSPVERDTQRDSIQEKSTRNPVNSFPSRDRNASDGETSSAPQPSPADTYSLPSQRNKYKSSPGPGLSSSPASPSRSPQSEDGSKACLSPQHHSPSCGSLSPARRSSDQEMQCDSHSSPATPGGDSRAFPYWRSVSRGRPGSHFVFDLYEGTTDGGSPRGELQSRCRDVVPDLSPQSLLPVPTSRYGSRLSSSSTSSSARASPSSTSEQLSPLPAHHRRAKSYDLYRDGSASPETEDDSPHGDARWPLADMRSASERIHRIAMQYNLSPPPQAAKQNDKESRVKRDGSGTRWATLPKESAPFKSDLPGLISDSPPGKTTGVERCSPSYRKYASLPLTTESIQVPPRPPTHNTLTGNDSYIHAHVDSRVLVPEGNGEANPIKNTNGQNDAGAPPLMKPCGLTDEGRTVAKPLWSDPAASVRTPESSPLEQPLKKRVLNGSLSPTGSRQDQRGPPDVGGEPSSTVGANGTAPLVKDRKVEQVLNRTKMTFSARWREEEVLRSRKKSKKMVEVSSTRPESPREVDRHEEIIRVYLKPLNNNNKLVNDNYHLQYSSVQQTRGLRKGSVPKDMQASSYENLSSPESIKDMKVNRNHWPSKDYGPVKNQCFSPTGYGTIPGRRSSASPRLSCDRTDFLLEDVENANVVFHSRSARKDSTSLHGGDSHRDAGEHPANSKGLKNPRSPTEHLSAAEARPRQGRSYSVSSVHVSRPSGYDQISTAAKLTSEKSLHAFSRARSYAFSYDPDKNSECDKTGRTLLRTRRGYKVKPPEIPIYSAEQQAQYLGQIKKSLTVGRIWKPGCFENPTSLKDEVSPSSSSSSPRSRLWSSSSASSFTSQDSPSPQGLMPWRGSYRSTPSAFEGSDSDTTTDDEYYLDADERDRESEL
ncbi:uncharacterized protein [Lepisosteus oculatus]|uniref:uncharacterized protein n=1 Tax=Lepisosteus oculatus TaxID=7918 RepID=UPI0037153AD8